MTSADSMDFRELCLEDSERVRKLQKLGRSLYVALPNCLKIIFNLTEGSRVKIIVENVDKERREAMLRLIVVR
ncbi:MAG: hypothetical protein GXO10_07535 [Crenarchaeota archaeon]|nr:hypothetical protein [Thermoproteota archaeon]